jgi:chromosome segregation ATPase
MTIARYNDDFNYTDEGEWVTYADHLEAMSALHSQVTAYEQELQIKERHLMEVQARITALEATLAKYDRLSERDSIEIAQLQTKLTEVEEANAWKISPAMAQAQLDQQQQRITQLEGALVEIRAGQWTSSGDRLGATFNELRACDIAQHALTPNPVKS